MNQKSLDNKKIYEGFNARGYLDHYYSKIGPENDELLEFYSKCYKGISSDAVLLEFSGGPALYPLIKAATIFKEIHFSDFVKANLAEVENWLKGGPDAFYWGDYIARALHYENPNSEVTKMQIETRMRLMRLKISRIFECNALSDLPIGNTDIKYDVIDINFVLEAIAQTDKEWKQLFGKILKYLKPTGRVVMTVVTGGTYYHIGENKLPTLNLSENKLSNFFDELGFHKSNQRTKSIQAEVLDRDDKNFAGYTGMIFIEAVRG